MTNQLQSALFLGLALGFTAGPSQAQLASQRIFPDEPGGGFGSALDMADGYAVVAVPTATVDGLAFAGRVDVYERVDSAIVSETEGEDGTGVLAESGLAQLVEGSEDRNASWIKRATLKAPEEEMDLFDQFGSSVSLDANRVAVGVSKEEGEGGVIDAGAVYVFRMTVAGEWIFEQKLVAPVGITTDRFGAAVALRGRELVVGAPGHDEAGSGSGIAYVFRRTPGEGWELEAELLPPELGPGDGFGLAVAVDAGHVLVGAPETTVNLAPQVGAVYPYRFEEESGQWLPEERVVSPDAPVPGQFGFSVAVVDDQAVVGAPSGNGGGGASGVAYSLALTDAWAIDQTLLSAASVPSARFGESVAFDGHTLAVGASRQDSQFATETGMVHVFRRVGAVWSERGRLAPCELGSGSGLGGHVALEGKRILASALNELPEAAVHAFRVTPLGLTTSPCPLSVVNGGRQEFAIHAGVQNAGRFYALLGSITGSAPGFDYELAHVPLNVDPYFSFTLAASSESLVGFNGTLNGVGSAFARVDLPGGIGLTVNTPLVHAYVILDPVSQFVVEASAPAPSTLVQTVEPEE